MRSIVWYDAMSNPDPCPYGGGGGGGGGRGGTAVPGDIDKCINVATYSY